MQFDSVVDPIPNSARKGITYMTQKILHEQASDIGLQNGVKRNRVPTTIIDAIGGEAFKEGEGKSDAIHWQAIQDGSQLYIVGTLVKQGAVGRQIPVAPKAAAKKAVAKKSAGKRPTPTKGSDLDTIFADAPAAPARPAPPARRPTPPAAIPAARRPVAPPAPPARRPAAPAAPLPRPVRRR